MREKTLLHSIIVGMVLLVLFLSTARASTVSSSDSGLGVMPVLSDARTPRITQPLLFAQTTTTITTFTGLSRYPAEDQYWMPMLQPTGVAAPAGYYRDVLAAGGVAITDATDGDTWTADITRPDGTTLTWQTVTFHRTWQTFSNCFVSGFGGGLLGGWNECGITGITLLYYTQTQCQQPGTWSLRVYYKEAAAASGTLVTPVPTEFMLLPQIPENKASAPGMRYGQLSYSTDHYDSVCRGGASSPSLWCQAFISPPVSCDYICADVAGERKITIAEEGCFLTSTTAILNYHGIGVDPSALDTWLTGYAKVAANNPNKILYKGYSPVGLIEPSAVQDYASLRGVAVANKPALPTNVKYWSGLTTEEKYICAFGPQMLRVRNNSHSVTLIGMDEARANYKVIDASDGAEKTLPKTAVSINNMRMFAGPASAVTPDRSVISIHFHSPGELLLTDPLGRRVGYDPVTKTAYDEFPDDAMYEEPLPHDDITGEVGTEGPKVIYIARPAAGEYSLRVVGTGTGLYTLDIYALDTQHEGLMSDSFENLPIIPGQVYSYGFYYGRDPGSESYMVGSYDGGGQRPKDVNRFLRYISPSESQTKLPAGSTAFDLMISYAKESLPATFKAALNNADISASFKPVPAGHETVRIPLTPGRNVLVLSVDGQLPTRTATDSDRLVFVVQ